MKLAIITAIFGRFDITLAFLTAMERLRQQFGIETYAVVAENDECIDLLKEFQVYYVEYPNKPVGRKFNQAVQMLKGADFTHTMVLGSDDIPSSGLIEYILTLGEYDIIGADGLWFWGMNPRRAGFGRFGFFPVPKVLAGAGKVISRRIVEACDYTLWPENCNYGMDAKMQAHIKSHTRPKGIKSTRFRYDMRRSGGFLVDVKYKHHISSMSPLTRRESWVEQDPYIILPQHLPIEECEYLFELHDITENNWEAKKEQARKNEIIRGQAS